MKKRIASAFLAVLLTTVLLTIPAQAYSIDELTVKSGLDYAQVGAFSKGYAAVAKDVDGDGHPEYGLIDSNGTLVVPLKYDYIGTVSEGFAKIGVDADENPKTGTRWITGGKGVEKFGFIDVTGKEIVPPIYDSVEDFPMEWRRRPRRISVRTMGISLQS